MKKIIVIFFLHITCLLSAQDKIYENYTFDTNIKSLQTIVNGIITSVPVLRLRSSDIMAVQFDDIGNREEDFYYKIIHCDRNWTPSLINEIEYIDGFNAEQIRDWQNSLDTKHDFIHYWMTLPNRDTRFKISGNYILYVYTEGNEDNPAFTKRFIVTESMVHPLVKWVRPTNTELIRFNQQMDLSFLVKNFTFQNAQRDVSISIIQNGDWKNSKNNIAARNIKDGYFTFDNFGELSFSGNNEFRWFDMRSLRSNRGGIEYIENNASGTDVLLKLGHPRINKVFSFNYDFNGKYYIDNYDIWDRYIIFDGKIASPNRLSEFRNYFSYNDLRNGWNTREESIRSDYANVIFSLQSPKLDKEVYIFGDFTDFQLKPEFKMIYNDEKGVYLGNVLLKQGYYDYAFAIPDEKGNPSFEYTEGKWQDTENEYKVIVHFSEFASRYDRVIGVITTSSTYYTE
jgi:hypothetical protein